MGRERSEVRDGMRIDWDVPITMDDRVVLRADVYRPIPEGKYVCKMAEIEEASTKNGDEMWKLRLEVVEGAHAGRYLFDNLVFSAAAMKRVKLICSRLGIDVSGTLKIAAMAVLAMGHPVRRVTPPACPPSSEPGRRR